MLGGCSFCLKEEVKGVVCVFVNLVSFDLSHFGCNKMTGYL
jgi:hypothetical protein